jgi:hypothetical protein
VVQKIKQHAGKMPALRLKTDFPEISFGIANRQFADGGGLPTRRYKFLSKLPAK